jgi:phage tail-like protein
MARRHDWLVNQLPLGMLDDEFFVRFVSMFQEVASTFLEGADNIPNVVDAAVAPPAMLPWLASWLGISWVDSSLPAETQRRVVRQAGQALAWRGTKRGLETVLQAITDDEVLVEDSGAVQRAGQGSAAEPFVRVTVSSTGWLSDEDFVELVADELPAPVRFAIVAGGRQIWPQPAGGDQAEIAR